MSTGQYTVFTHFFYIAVEMKLNLNRMVEQTYLILVILEYFAFLTFVKRN